jgi:hypothetical protein
MIRQTQLKFDKPLFEILQDSVSFEDVTKGRKGANVAKIEKEGDITIVPLVRTTTRYKNPTQPFKSVHEEVIYKIKENFSDLKLDFNNALIEIYDSRYKTMAFHSDLSLDLDKDSYIAIFSCYKGVIEGNYSSRNLVVKSKGNNDCINFKLYNNSVILFSIDTNSKCKHKIELDKNHNKDENIKDWLGITFRFSKTKIEFKEGVPKTLTLATKEDEQNFLKYRKLENDSNFTYPEIKFTLSPGDLIL